MSFGWYIQFLTELITFKNFKKKSFLKFSFFIILFTIIFGIIIPKCVGYYEVIGVIDDETKRFKYAIFGIYQNEGNLNYKNLLLFIYSSFFGYFFYSNLKNSLIYIKKIVNFAIIFQLLIILLYYLGFDFYDFKERTRAFDTYGPRFYLGFVEPSYMSVVLTPMLAYIILFSKKKITIFKYLLVSLFFILTSRSGSFFILLLSIILIYRFQKLIFITVVLSTLFIISSNFDFIRDFLSNYELFNSIHERTRFDGFIDPKVLLFGSGIINVFSPIPILNFIYPFGILGVLLLILFFKPSTNLVMSALLIYAVVPRTWSFEAMLGLVFLILLDQKNKSDKKEI